MEILSVNKNNSEIYEDFLKTYGGEENLEKYFPQTFKCVQNDIIENDCQSTDMSIVFVGKTNDSKIQVHAKLCHQAKKYNRFIIEIREKISKKLIANKDCCQFIGNITVLSLFISQDYYDNSEINLKAYLVGDSINYIEEKYNLNDFGLDSVDFNIIHPKQLPEHPIEDKNINISYKYTSNPVFWDYKYNFYSGNFMLPTEGSFSGITNRYTFEGVSLSVMNNVGVEYKHVTATSGFIIKDNTVSWKLNENWGFDLYSCIKSCTELKYAMQIYLKLNGKTITYTITNNDSYKDGSNIKKINKIVAYRDCIIEGTLIETCDSIKIPVENLKAGHSILTDSGLKKIKQILSCESDVSLVSVMLENGFSITLTDNHPVYTERGFFEAKDLINEKIKTSDGFYKATHIENYMAKEKILYSIEIEGEAKCAIANDIFIHIISETTLTVPSNEEIRFKLPENLLVDFDNLTKLSNCEN